MREAELAGKPVSQYVKELMKRGDTLDIQEVDDLATSDPNSKLKRRKTIIKLKSHLNMS